MKLKRNLLLIMFAFIFTVFVSFIPDIIMPSYWKSLDGTQLLIAIVVTIIIFVVAISSMIYAVKYLKKYDEKERKEVREDNEKRDQLLVERLTTAFKEALKEDREARSKK